MARVTIVDGTPDEVLAIVKGLEDSKPAAPSAPETSAVRPVNADPDKKVFASTEVARKVFSRRPLSSGQRAVISTLGKAHPNWVPAADLQGATGYTPAQFAGLMGAFGRRFTHTDGWIENSWLFDAEWNYETGAYDYRLPDTVVEAAKLEKLI